MARLRDVTRSRAASVTAILAEPALDAIFSVHATFHSDLSFGVVCVGWQSLAIGLLVISRFIKSNPGEQVRQVQHLELRRYPKHYNASCGSRVHKGNFKPGQKVSNGVYWVHHYAHRETHLVSVVGGTFPKCNRCGDRVRFESALGRKADLVWEDPDFRNNAS